MGFPKEDISGNIDQRLLRSEFLLGFSHTNCLKDPVASEAKSEGSPPTSDCPTKHSERDRKEYFPSKSTLGGGF